LLVVSYQLTVKGGVRRGHHPFLLRQRRRQEGGMPLLIVCGEIGTNGDNGNGKKYFVNFAI
jgi:hypothetical protein